MVLDATASAVAPGSAPPRCWRWQLLVTGLGLGRARLRHAQLIVQLGELLLVHEPAAGADDVVLALVALDQLLGIAHALAQLAQA